MTTTRQRKMDVTIKVDIPFSTRCIDEFIGLKCATDLLRLYPNAKEITESMAVFGAIKRFKSEYPSILGDSDVVCLCPGDGVHPRTAALAAYRTRWTCYSIDPLAKETFQAARLWYRKAKAEDLPVADYHDKRIVILSTHSHAKLDDILRTIGSYKTLYVIALQCCVPMEIKGHSPFKVYRDCGVFSPENEIKLWKIQ